MSITKKLNKTTAPKFQFNRAQFQSTSEDWNWTAVGTLAELAVGSRFRFSKKNLESKNRVAILISDAKGSYENGYVISCTQSLSDKVREWIDGEVSLKEIMSALVKLTVQADKDDASRYFLFSPQGNGEMLPDFSAKDLDGQVDYEALSAL